MSSHHIVREKQEPALYIHHLGTFDEEYLGQLLEWSPTLIVSSQDYEKVISLGLKVDVVVNSALSDASFQENTKTILAKDDSLDAVLDYLIAAKYPAVNVIDSASTSKLRELGSYVSEISIVIFTDIEKAFAIKSGFSVWKPKDTVYHIEVISYFETSNLKQREDGSFVVINDGFVEFLFTTPYLFISEML